MTVCNIENKGCEHLSQIEIVMFIAQTALTYIFVQVASGNAQKQAVTDHKTDLRTTKEDIMAELKDSRESLLRDSEVSTTAIIDVLRTEIKAECEKIRKE